MLPESNYQLISRSDDPCRSFQQNYLHYQLVNSICLEAALKKTMPSNAQRSPSVVMKYEKLNDLEDDELVDDLSPSKESRFRNKPVEPTG